MQPKKSPVILCGIAGGIAAYKTVDTVSRLHKAGLDVRVVMTPAAQQFVTPLTFQALLGRPVGTNFFCPPTADTKEEIYPHLYPSGDADLFLVMPATADIISKLAAGEADDLVSASSLGLAPTCKKIFCPAMNTNMWKQPVVSHNVELLEQHGWICIGPEDGLMACGTQGEGRMTEPADITEQILTLLAQPTDLAGKKVLILSGPTHEHLDPVRFIGNPSSGKMGKALTENALMRGATVELITGPVPAASLPQGEHLTTHSITSASEMLHAAQELFASADIIIFAAAVSDYTPKEPSNTKRSKSSTPLQLTLEPTPDIAATLSAQKKSNQITVGFALQDTDALTRAKEKLQAKHLDLIILNTLQAMGADHADYHCLKAGIPEAENWGKLSKRTCAEKIFKAALECA